MCVIRALSQGARQLHTIILHDCSRITDLGLQALGSRPPACVPYETIDISACERIGDAGVLALLHGCSSLTSLNMADCTRVRVLRMSPCMISVRARSCAYMIRTHLLLPGALILMYSLHFRTAVACSCHGLFRTPPIRDTSPRHETVYFHVHSGAECCCSDIRLPR